MASKREHNLIIEAFHGEVTEYKAAKALKINRMVFGTRMKKWVKQLVADGKLEFISLRK